MYTHVCVHTSYRCKHVHAGAYLHVWLEFRRKKFKSSKIKLPLSLMAAPANNRPQHVLNAFGSQQEGKNLNTNTIKTGMRVITYCPSWATSKEFLAIRSTPRFSLFYKLMLYQKRLRLALKFGKQLNDNWDNITVIMNTGRYVHWKHFPSSIFFCLFEAASWLQQTKPSGPDGDCPIVLTAHYSETKKTCLNVQKCP